MICKLRGRNVWGRVGLRIPSHGARCADGMNAAPRFVGGKKKAWMGGPAVIFQEVVHSIRTGEAVCDEQAVYSGEIEWTTTRMPHGRL